MTYEEASRLVLIMTMNYAGFMPPEPTSAAAKKGMWAEVLSKYDYALSMDAVQRMLKEVKFPPTIADFCEYLGVGRVNRQEMEARLTGPVYGTQEGFDAMYTADPAHVDEIMKKLERDLASMKTFDGGRK